MNFKSKVALGAASVGDVLNDADKADECAIRVTLEFAFAGDHPQAPVIGAADAIFDIQRRFAVCPCSFI